MRLWKPWGGILGAGASWPPCGRAGRRRRRRSPPSPSAAATPTSSRSPALLAIAIALTASPVVYQTVERLELLKVGAVLLFVVVAVFAADQLHRVQDASQVVTASGRSRRARSRSRSSSAPWPPPARAAPTTSCRATGSATRASAWAATCRGSSRRSPARRRRRRPGERSVPRGRGQPGPLAGVVAAGEPRAVRLVRPGRRDLDNRVLARGLLDRVRQPGPARRQRLRLHLARGRRARRAGGHLVRHAVPGHRRGQPVRRGARASWTTSPGCWPTRSDAATREGNSSGPRAGSTSWPCGRWSSSAAPSCCSASTSRSC